MGEFRACGGADKTARTSGGPVRTSPQGTTCCNPDCGRDGTLYVGDLTTLGNYACSLCEVYIAGDGNDD